MTERINSKKLIKNIGEVRDLLEANREYLDTEEYLASRVALTAVDVAIEKSKEVSWWDKIKKRRGK